MSNPLSDTYETAKHAMDSAEDVAAAAGSKTKRAIGSAQDGAEQALTSARATWWDGVKAVTGIVMMVRSLRANDALGWVGLSRRRNPLFAAGVFGAGIAVGAGAALLLAPGSGVELRRRIVDRFAGRAQPKTTLETAGQAVETVAVATKNLAVEAAHQAIDHVAAKMPHARDAAAPSASVDGNGLHVA
jgi:gas vesicle protein